MLPFHLEKTCISWNSLRGEWSLGGGEAAGAASNGRR